MLDRAAYPRLRVQPAPQLPIAQLVVGKPVEEAAALLPRVFNLCRVAQETAARAAFGLPLAEGWQDALRREILCDHVMKLCLTWPSLLSLPAPELPRGWQNQPETLPKVLFGQSLQMPDTFDEFAARLEADVGIFPVLYTIGQSFAKGEACRSGLPPTTPDSLFSERAQDNSVATRRASHPVLQGLAAQTGRGPLWAATALALDLDAYLAGEMPTLTHTPDGTCIQAARGYYGVRAEVENGHVTAFERVTPTDHLLMPGGVLAQSLKTLKGETATAWAPLLLSILDPCHPVELYADDTQEAHHA